MAGKNGEFKFDCPLDAHFLNFTGLTGADIKKLLEAEKGDGEIVQWIQANAPLKRRLDEIVAWSNYHDTRGPSDVESREYFHGLHIKYAPSREDISSWFDLLDVDDFVSFGGVA